MLSLLTTIAPQNAALLIKDLTGREINIIQPLWKLTRVRKDSSGVPFMAANAIGHSPREKLGHK